MSMEYTLSQILDITKHTFDEFLGEFQFWCTAEVVSCKTVGKNTYIELVEYDEFHTVLAKSRGNVFKPGLMERFFAKTGLQEQSLVGQKIMFQGRMTYHKDYGVSILINILSHSFTLGELQQSKNDILGVLQKEGIHTYNKSKNLPTKPLNIAIISGSTSAGLEDFLAILQDSGIHYEYTLFEATVHGNNARDAVLTQISDITQISNNTFDLICIIRGGGESSGIIWQNDIDIARAMCLSPIPVLVAIGHTQDSSVLEDIAWKFAKTPSEAAFLIVHHYENIHHNITEMIGDITHICTIKTSQLAQNIVYYYENIENSIKQIYQNTARHIDFLYQTIQQYHPQHLLEKGYAIVRETTTGQLVDHYSARCTDETGCLQPGDTVAIQTAMHEIDATVVTVTKRHL